MTADGTVQLPIDSDEHIVDARAEGRALATKLGFSRTDATLIATAISEIARNILVHAGSGEVAMRPEMGDRRCGLVVVASDSGPGIRDVDAALQDGYGTGGGLGLGLPGVKRIMDDFRVETGGGRGTTVEMAMWRERDGILGMNGSR
jgi:serine/threonine-protein kinase RsbT